MRIILVWFILWWIGGIVLGVAQVSYEKIAVIISVAFVFCLLLSRWPRPITVGLTLVSILGTLWGHYSTHNSPHASSECKDEQSFKGIIKDRPVYTGLEARFFLHSPQDCIYLAYVESSESLGKGDEVQVVGKLQRVSDISSEDDSFRDYLIDYGAQGVVRGEAIVLNSHSSRFQYVRSFLLERLYGLFPEPEGSLAAAMIFDERGGLSKSLQEKFRITGTSHILAISGSNISFLAAILLIIFLFIPISPWARTVTILLIMWLYVGLIDMPVSAVRATVFWTAALLAFRLSSLLSLTSIIAVAVLGMVSLRPALLTDVGFQLSLAAVCGIGLVLFLTNRLLQERRTVSGMDLILSSGGAFVATWPIVMYHFGTISWVGLIANIFVVPLMSVLYFLMILVLVVDFISHMGAMVLSGAAHFVWLAIHYVTSLFARIPYGYIEELSIPGFLIGIYYILLLSGASYILRSQRRSWRELWQ